MATTTNYGWTTPDDTALVKDGASAIRSLGSSVDTTVFGLNNLTLVNTGGTAMTGAGTITVSSIPARSKLIISVVGMSSATASSNFNVTFNSDTGANYFYGAVGRFGGGNNATDTNATAGTSIYFSRQGDNAANTVDGQIFIDGARGTGRRYFSYSSNATGATTSLCLTGTGNYFGANAISSVSFISSVGNFDAGTIYVYASAS